MAKINQSLVRRASKAQELRDKQSQALRIYGDDIARVSTVLGTWNDDPEERLMDWAAFSGFSWRADRDEAATIGTHVHEMIEDCLKLVQNKSLEFSDLDSYMGAFQTMSAGFQKVAPRHREVVMRCFMAFLGWASRFQRFDIIALEEKIISQDLKVGGTCDFKGILDWGQGPARVLLDWKTSKSTNMKHKVQLAAYSILHKCKHPNDPPFDYYGVIRFDKVAGTWHDHFTDHKDILEDEEFFMHLVQGFHMRRKLKMF